MLGIQHGWQIMIIMMLEIYLYSYLGAFFLRKTNGWNLKIPGENIEIHPRHPFFGGSMFTFQGGKTSQHIRYLHVSESSTLTTHWRVRWFRMTFPDEMFAFPKRYILAIAIGKTNPHNKNGSIQVGIDGGIPNVWSFACLRAGHTSLAQKMVGGEGSAFLLSQKPSQPTQRPITSGAAA